MENILDSESGKETQDHATLQELADNGFSFDFGTYFNDAIEQWKQNWALFAGFAFVSLLLIVISMFTIVGTIIIALPLTVGYHYAVLKQYRGEEVEFNDFFGGFKKTGDLLVYVLILIGIILIPMGVLVALSVPMAIAGNDMNEGAQIGFILIQFVVQMVVMVLMLALQSLTFFAPTLITVGGLNGMAAFKASAKIAKRNFWWILLYAFVAGLMGQIDVYACGIGLFFTLALTEIMRVTAYKHIFGLHDRSGEEIV